MVRERFWIRAGMTTSQVLALGPLGRAAVDALRRPDTSAEVRRVSEGLFLVITPEAS